jgi:hypothetical protein
MQNFGNGNKGVRLDLKHLLRKFRKLHTHVLRVNSALQKELRSFMLNAKSNCYVRHVCPSTWHSRVPSGRIFVKFCIGCILLQYVHSVQLNSRIPSINFCLFKQAVHIRAIGVY